MRIREHAEGFLRIAAQLTGSQDSFSFVLRCLAVSFSDVLQPLISARIGEQFYTLQDLVGAILYAEQVAQGWAEDVETFKLHRADLLERWDAAYRNGFWITRTPGYDNVEPEMRETLYDDGQRREWRCSTHSFRSLAQPPDSRASSGE